MEKRPELIAAAKENFLQKLAELGKKAEELANRQDQLTESMKAEAKQNAGQLEAERKEQEAIEKDARKLAAATELNEARQLVNPLDLEAVKKAMEALKSGDAAAPRRNRRRSPRTGAVGGGIPEERHAPDRSAEGGPGAGQASGRSAEEDAGAGERGPDGTGKPTPSEEQKEQQKDLAAEQAAIQAAAAQLEVPKELATSRRTPSSRRAKPSGRWRPRNRRRRPKPPGERSNRSRTWRTRSAIRRSGLSRR